MGPIRGVGKSPWSSPSWTLPPSSWPGRSGSPSLCVAGRRHDRRVREGPQPIFTAMLIATGGLVLLVSRPPGATRPRRARRRARVPRPVCRRALPGPHPRARLPALPHHKRPTPSDPHNPIDGATTTPTATDRPPGPVAGRTDHRVERQRGRRCRERRNRGWFARPGRVQVRLGHRGPLGVRGHAAVPQQAARRLRPRTRPPRPAAARHHLLSLNPPCSCGVGSTIHVEVPSQQGRLRLRSLQST